MFRERDYQHFTNEDLIKAYHATEDDYLRQELIDLLFRKNTRFCHHIAQKVEHSRIEYDDIYASAQLGMLKAFYLFKPETGYRFTTYAGRSMLNEIYMLFRKDNRIPSLVYLDEPLDTNEESDRFHTRLDMLQDTKSDILPLLIEQDLVRYANETLATILSPKEQILFLNAIADEKLTQRELATHYNVTQSIISRWVKSANAKMRNFVNRQDFSPTDTYNDRVDV